MLCSVGIAFCCWLFCLCFVLVGSLVVVIRNVVLRLHVYVCFVWFVCCARCVVCFDLLSCLLVVILCSDSCLLVCVVCLLPLSLMLVFFVVFV